MRPIWAEVALGVLGCAAMLGLAAFANGNMWTGLHQRHWVVRPPEGGPRGGVDVDCGQAGTVMRFVPPVAALATGDVDAGRDLHEPVRLNTDR